MSIQMHSNAPAILTNVLFNSANYYVAEVSQGRALQGFEVVDKFSGRGAFLDGAVALRMRASFQAMAADSAREVTPDDVDEFIRGFDALLLQRVVFH